MAEVWVPIQRTVTRGYYELRGTLRHFASAAFRALKPQGKFCASDQSPDRSRTADGVGLQKGRRLCVDPPKVVVVLLVFLEKATLRERVPSNHFVRGFTASGLKETDGQPCRNWWDQTPVMILSQLFVARATEQLGSCEQLAKCLIAYRFGADMGGQPRFPPVLLGNEDCLLWTLSAVQCPTPSSFLFLAPSGFKSIWSI